MPEYDGSRYEKQAADFLARFGIRFRATRANRNTCPPFCDDSKHTHGDRYTVTLSRPQDGRITFAFWNSLQDSRTGADLTPYDVLACLSSDIYCPQTFGEFCDEYGYEEDSRKAYATFKRASAFSDRLNRFFTAEETAALSLIQ